MMGRRAARYRGRPALSKPVRTRGDPNSGSTPPIGSSSVSLPCSTICIAAVQVTALVIEAIQKTESVVISTPLSRPRFP